MYLDTPLGPPRRHLVTSGMLADCVMITSFWQFQNNGMQHGRVPLAASSYAVSSLVLGVRHPPITLAACLFSQVAADAVRRSPPFNFELLSHLLRCLGDTPFWPRQL